MENLVEIDRQLKSLGLVRREIPKDGSCLFRCISESIFGTQSYHRNIRLLGVKYIKLNRDSFEPFACINYTWEKYLESISQEGTWGGEVELQAISILFQVNFIIYLGNATTRVDNGYKKNILLAYCSGEHYDLVYPTSHFENYKKMQTIVYDLIFNSLNYHPKLNHNSFKNLPLIIWEEEDKIKQKRDAIITDKLSQIQSINILDEYQLNVKKKANAKANNKNNRLKIEPSLNSSSESLPKSQTTPPTTSTQAFDPYENVDDEFKEILKQIEQQELEEQRLLGLEKHFPTLGPKNKKSPPTVSVQPKSFENDFEEIPQSLIDQIQETALNTPPKPVWSAGQNWSQLLEVEVETIDPNKTPSNTTVANTTPTTTTTTTTTNQNNDKDKEEPIPDKFEVKTRNRNRNKSKNNR